MTENIKDRLNESLSALMDGEADELEIRRLLNQMDDPDLQDQWKHHHMLGAIMRDEPIGNLDLTAAINAGIDGETDSLVADEPQAPTEQVAEKGWLKSLTSAAIAASVTLAVLLGVQSLDSSSTAQSGALVQQAPELIESRQQLAQDSGNTASEQLVSAEELEKSQQQLQEYVLKNSDNPALNTDNGVKPYARVVNFGDKAETESDK